MIFSAVCLVLEGPKGSGKTTALGSAIRALADAGRTVACVSQPDTGRNTDGTARGFDIELAGNFDGPYRAERIPLAVETEEPVAPGRLALGKYLFDATAFSRAGEFMERALSGGKAPEFIGLDEIGRLELERGEGLFRALSAALDFLSAGPRYGGSRALLCVVRGELAEGFADRLRERGIEALSVAGGRFPVP